MTRLTALAAALAAGLTSFAAHSQEAPVNFADAFSAAEKAEATTSKAPAPAEPVISAAHEGRGMMHRWTPVDATVTASVRNETQTEKKTATASDAASKATRKAAQQKQADGPKLVARSRKEIVLEKVTEPVKTAAAPAGAKYHKLVAKYAAAYGVPVSLAHAVIRVESNYRPGARGRAGEVGLMQIKPSTARGIGYTGSIKALYDPATNLRWGMKYLGMAHRLGGGTTCGTILKYNAGHGAKRMNPVSAAYCAKVRRHMG